MKKLYLVLLVLVICFGTAWAALVDDLLSKDADIRAKANNKLSSLPVNAKVEVVPALSAVIKQQLNPETSFAIDALRSIGNPAAGLMLEKLRSEEFMDRSPFMSVIKDLGPEVVAEIYPYLKNNDKYYRVAAAVTLISLKAKMDQAAGILGDILLSDEKGAIVAVCVYNLGKVEDLKPELIALIVDKIGNKDEVVSVAAINACGELGPKAKIAVKKLIEIVKAENYDQRLMSVKALSKIGEEAFECLPVLLTLIKSNDVTIVHNIINAIEGIGVDPGKCVPALQLLLRSEDYSIRASAASAMGSFGNVASEAVPALAETLKNSVEDYEQTKILQALEMIGTEAAMIHVKVYKDKIKPKLNKRK